MEGLNEYFTRKLALKYDTYTNIEDLPLTLNAREAAGVLRISKSKVYELARTESFPAIRIGNRVVIPRDKLIEWMNTQAEVSV